MKKIVFTVGLLTVIVLGFILVKAIPVFAGGLSADSSKGKKKQVNPVLVVERDVPQTRVGFEPIVNHEAMVVNLSKEVITVDIESPIPPGLYVVKKFVPAFGYNTLLGMPMESPQKVEVSQYKILERPDIVTRGDKTVFRWNNVSVPAGQAVIAQYDNYLGPLSQYYTKSGLRILDVDIRSAYKTSLVDGGKAVVLDLSYEIENLGREEMRSILMDVIVPDKVFPEGSEPPVQLFETADAVASPPITMMRGMLGDGFGKAAEGIIFSISIDSIKPGESQTFWMKVIGKNWVKEGRSYPLLSFQGETTGSPIWPATKLKSKKKLQITAHSYRHANLILPDNRLFKFEPSEVKIVEMTGEKDEKLK
jgi:hypothetical protein